MEAVNVEELLDGQEEIWELMFAFADSMALKCAVELGIVDIIHSHGCPISSSQIASAISDAPSPDISYLARIMRMLVHKGLFTEHHGKDLGEVLYGLNNQSKWLLSSSDLSLVPMILMQTHPLLMAPWHYFGKCVREGGIAFKKAHGCDVWDLASQNPKLNQIFNDAMACAAKNVIGALLSEYKGFNSVGTVLDLGGGIGKAIAEIAKSYPHVTGINFDLPHVVASAPSYERVTHVGGDMFESIPKAEAIFIKWVLHDWSDEQCVKILKNCKRAIPEKTGKIIIVDTVVEEGTKEPFDNTRRVFDLVMMAHASGGKERTEVEWKKLLEEGGFSSYKIIKIPAIPSVIEAYPA